MLKKLFGACAAVLALSAPSHAQDAYPNDTIRIIVGFAAGGGTDNLSRVLAQAMSERLGQPVVIENQPGAAGTIAANYVSRAKPDGYTLLTLSSSSMTSAELQKDRPFDTFKDLQAISLLQRSPIHFLVTKGFEAQDLKSAIELIKANPGKYTYAHAGTGGAGDLMGRLMQKVIGLDMVSVPYAGDAQSAPDVASGVVPFWASGLSGSKGMWEAGRVTMLATSSAERAPYAPDVPTFKELGYDVDYYFFNALMAPAGTPPEIIQKLDSVIADIYSDPELKKQIGESAGVLPDYLPSAEATEFMKGYMDSLTDILAEVKSQM